LNLTHVKDVSIGDYDRYACNSLQVDGHFIAVSARKEDARTTINFISQKSFQVERSLSFSSSCFEKSFYDGGYLFLMNNDFLVRILDVASGTFLREIRMEPSIFNNVINIRANSNYVVIAATESERWNWLARGGPSELFIYDLNCLKETDGVPTHLLTTIDLGGKVKKM
jgi:hypothetical protein